MTENSKIEWCDHTFNPWIGCQKVSAACDNCYAEDLMANRYKKVEWGPHGERKRTSPENWKKPLQWAKKDIGRRQRVFSLSLGDWLDNKVPWHWLAGLGKLIRETPELDWLLLTKRIENYHKLAPWNPEKPPPNVWLGITCEDQTAYDRQWPWLASFPATVRFISYEPGLGPISLNHAVNPHWVICGGESGPHARPYNLDWPRSMLVQCRAKGISCLVKQLGKRPVDGAEALKMKHPKGGGWSEWPNDLRVREWPSASGR